MNTQSTEDPDEDEHKLSRREEQEEYEKFREDLRECGLFALDLAVLVSVIWALIGIAMLVGNLFCNTQTP